MLTTLNNKKHHPSSHTHLPGWEGAAVAWMASGGYAVADTLPQVSCPTLVLWGRQDKILDPAWGERLTADLPDARREGRGWAWGEGGAGGQARAARRAARSLPAALCQPTHPAFPCTQAGAD